MAVVLSIVAALAAIAGGYLALKSRRQLNLSLGFTAGIILGLVAFDLLPEIFELAQSAALDLLWPMIALVGGFLIFHAIEKFILLHHASEDKYGPHTHPHVGVAGSIALIGHSLLDGVSVGVAFQISDEVGVAVAIAVIAHRFTDGFNVVNLMLQHKNKIRAAKKMLAVAAVMPILGGLSTLLFSLSETVLAIYLGSFAGFLLYIGASDILPQAHSKGSSRWTILLTVAGAAVMLMVSRLA